MLGQTSRAGLGFTEDAASAFSSAAVGGLAFLGGSAISSVGGMLNSVVSEKESENLIDFKYHKAETAAKQTGMPLANVLGFGSSLSPATNFLSGGASRTTQGQGLSNVPYKGTLSQITSGYGLTW